MGTFGFSYIGLIFLLMLTIPNVVWIYNRPKGYDSDKENKLFLLFERIGQVCVTFVVLSFSNFNIRGWSLWTLWLILAFAVMILYECWWIRYFRSERKLGDFYSSYIGIPVAGATLPVIGFFLLSMYGRVVWLTLSIIILGIGHIGIHLQHLKDIK